MVAEAHFSAIQTGGYYAWVSSGMLEVKGHNTRTLQEVIWRLPAFLFNYHVSISLSIMWVGLAVPIVILQVENVADWPARNECGGAA